ncbi:hypothetical protein KAU11_07395 [Candidatus Babeliales bacterium]|nr:hypothetical protein [Candidatus Babeliales bacterium]
MKKLILIIILLISVTTAYSNTAVVGSMWKQIGTILFPADDITAIDFTGVSTIGIAEGEDYILIRDEKASGITGGSFTSGAWRTRDLNTIVTDIGSHASIASNQITLAGGTYKVEGYAPGMGVNEHKIKLRNITDGVDLVIGTSMHASATGPTNSISTLDGRFTIAAPKVLELQHRSFGSQATYGFGTTCSFGVIEVYSVIKFWKEA